MSYLTQALLTEDGDIWKRVTACAAEQGVSAPTIWVQEHLWQLAVQPGWGSAYATALVEKLENPGLIEAVITDGMILSAVQALLNQEA